MAPRIFAAYRGGREGKGVMVCAAKLVHPLRLVPITRMLGSVIDVVISRPDVTARHSCWIAWMPDSKDPLEPAAAWPAAIQVTYLTSVLCPKRACEKGGYNWE